MQQFDRVDAALGTMHEMEDRALVAFRRLLADGAAGGQAKVDAIVALAQRAVFVATWTPGGDDFRTLINSNGQNALPLFTDVAQLNAAAERLGWLGASGSVPYQEIGARKAFRHLLAHDLGFLIVDIAAPHSLECERGEIEPLMQRAGKEPSGPYAAVGRISETMLQAVKATPPKGTPMGEVPAPAVPASALESSPGVVRPPEDALPTLDEPPAPAAAPAAPAAPPPGVAATPASSGGASATFGSGGSSVKIHPITQEPGDELLDAISTVLRGYPEVEWAAFCMTARGPASPLPTIGLRVDTSYRARVNEIIKEIRTTGDAKGASLDVLLLDDPALVRSARSASIVFFPWRRRS